MKFLAITQEGLEKFCQQEVQELCNTQASAEKGFVIFEASEEDALRFAEHAQSISSLLVLFDTFSVFPGLDKTMAELKKVAHRINLDDWLDSTTFAVRCSRTGDHTFNSPDIAKEASLLLIPRTKSKIHLKHPDVIVKIIIADDKGAIGIDVMGFDASKRDYRVVLHAAETSALLSYAIVRAAGKDKNATYLDPLCGSGQIVIEATLWMQGISPHEHRDITLTNLRPFSKTKSTDISPGKGKVIAIDGSMPNLRGAEKNARVAGVKKMIDFSRTPLQDLDLRCEPNSVDAIVTMIAGPNRRIPTEVVQKRADKLFNQAENILKKDGVVSLLIKDPTLIKPYISDWVVSSTVIKKGEESYTLLVLSHEAS